ncbi:MAG: AMP-binding protein, partial [Legionella longbeachae]|nr:AMP-binding protein [Legionella longbeachae]
MGRAYKCIIIGDNALTIECAKILIASNFSITLFSTLNSEVTAWAHQNSITLLNDLHKLEYSQIDCDFIFSIANTRILSQTLLALAKYLAINYHNAPLPKYAGAYANAWAILNNENLHGVTWHVMTEKIDGGDILEQSFFPIEETDTAFTLNIKCFEHALKSFQILVSNLNRNTFTPIPQNPQNRSYYTLAKKPKNNGIIDFNDDAISIHRMIRALNFGHLPNEFCHCKIVLKNQFYFPKEAVVLNIQSVASPGTVIAYDNFSLQITTKTHDIRITRLCNQYDCIQNIFLLFKKLGIKINNSLLTCSNHKTLENLKYKTNDLDQAKQGFYTDKKIHKLIQNQAKKIPNKIAIIDEYAQITYQELEVKSNQLAQLLVQSGIHGDTMIGIYLDRNSNIIVSVLAVLKCHS